MRGLKKHDTPTLLTDPHTHTLVPHFPVNLLKESLFHGLSACWRALGLFLEGCSSYFQREVNLANRCLSLQTINNGVRTVVSYWPPLLASAVLVGGWGIGRCEGSATEV